MNCSNCGRPTAVWVVVNIEKKWTKPEKIGTRDELIGSSDKRWCLECLRGKNDPPYAKPYDK